MERRILPQVRHDGVRAAGVAGGALRPPDAGGPDVPQGERLPALPSPAFGECGRTKRCGEVSFDDGFP